MSGMPDPDQARSPRPRPLDPRYEVRLAEPGEAGELLPLMRAYCEFYESDPADAGLLEMARTLASDPEQGGIFVARKREAEAVGFAAMSWKWSSTRGARIAFLEDLYCAPAARGRGVADALIGACSALAAERGAPVLEWLTAPDNLRAQAVYERLGGEASDWRAYEIPTGTRRSDRPANP